METTLMWIAWGLLCPHFVVSIYSQLHAWSCRGRHDRSHQPQQARSLIRARFNLRHQCGVSGQWR